MRMIVFVFMALILSNGPANAESCPDFFRFFDFGLETSDGPIRGGPTYRAESFNGQPMLIRELSVCREVRSVASDGHGVPIPVVTSVNYDPKSTGIDLNALRLTVSEDVASETEQNAAKHLARLELKGVVILRGPEYLCASLAGPNEISCQLVSPFGGNLALVVYCDLLKCSMPSVAVNEKVIASATWPSSRALLETPGAAALQIAERVQQAHDFLVPLSSWRPDFTRFDP